MQSFLNNQELIWNLCLDQYSGSLISGCKMFGCFVRHSYISVVPLCRGGSKSGVNEYKRDNAVLVDMQLSCVTLMSKMMMMMMMMMMIIMVVLMVMLMTLVTMVLVVMVYNSVGDGAGYNEGCDGEEGISDGVGDGRDGVQKDNIICYLIIIQFKNLY